MSHPDKPVLKTVGPWQVHSQDVAFDNPWIQVRSHDVLHPDGSPGHYGVVHFKNLAIGVLPIDEDGCTWLVGQHRFCHDRYSWELPEGGGPLDDDPLASAQRELAEETGFTADNWAEISRFDVSNSVTDERSICYLAWGLTPGKSRPEPSEQLQIRKIPFAALLEDVISGKITDSLTIIMVMTAYMKAMRGDLPPAVNRLLLG